MTDLLPRPHIPDEWATQAKCPVCHASPLSVQRAPGQPDQMLCGRCGTTFVVEQTGPRVRLTHWPPALTPHLPTIASAWLTIAEIKALVQKVKPPSPTPSPPPPPASEPAPAPITEVNSTPASPSNLDLIIERAQKLYALGNRPMVIEASLKNSGATAEEIQAALEVVRELEAQKRRGQQNRLRWASAVALAGLVVVAAFALANSFGRRPAAPMASGTPSGPTTATPIPYNPVIGLINNLLPTDVAIVNGPSPTPGPPLLIFPTATLGKPPDMTPDSGLPDWALTAAPPGVKIVDVPTPSVERGVGPGESACPLTADEAAALFGGKKDYWAYASQQNGWTLIVADNPITITIPANMTAGYLVVGESLYMTSVIGPATIRNVNFGAVSCE